jgi:hypothetical protein
MTVVLSHWSGIGSYKLMKYKDGAKYEVVLTMEYDRCIVSLLWC